MKKNIFISLLLLLGFQFLSAQPAPGYYDTSKGTKGSALKTALHHIIKDPEVSSYSSLKDLFRQTDNRPDGKVWDMYSRDNNMSFSGGGYNREHSFPKSWFGGKIPPMYSDLFHIYPTTISVNSARWHYPYGENNGEEKSFDDGFCKLGKCTTPGYTGTVFEPADEYKGDFARTYFYMVTCYENLIPQWKYINGNESQGEVVMLNQTTYPAFSEWALHMLMRWASADPVSQKELDRNNAVCRIQGNRNPFIDYPGLEQYIWGSMTGTAFDPDNYDSDIKPGPGPVYVNAPVFSPQSGVVAAGTEVTISTTTPGASIHYTINQGTEQTASSPVKVTIQEKTSISAYTVLDDAHSTTTTAEYILITDLPSGENIYHLLNDVQSLTPGLQLIIASPEHQTAMSESKGDIRGYVEVTISNDMIDSKVNETHAPYAFVLGGTAGQWTFYDSIDQVYLAYTGGKNKLQSISEASKPEAQWNISIEPDGTALITNKAYTKRAIKYNSSAPRFACYESGQANVSIYAQLSSTGISEINRAAEGTVRIYDLNGRLIRQCRSAQEALYQLPSGFYIVNGQKILIK